MRSSRRRLSVGLLVVLAGLGAFVLAGHRQRARQQLPGPWIMDYFNGQGFVIYRYGDRPPLIADAVGPSVRCFGISGAVVTGHVKAAPSDPNARTGWFVIDTRTQMMSQGLSERTWEARLRELGVAEKPPLTSPAMFPMFQGC